MRLKLLFAFLLIASCGIACNPPPDDDADRTITARRDSPGLVGESPIPRVLATSGMSGDAVAARIPIVLRQLHQVRDTETALNTLVNDLASVPFGESALESAYLSLPAGNYSDRKLALKALGR